jgi:hypothetical protein
LIRAAGLVFIGHELEFARRSGSSDALTGARGTFGSLNKSMRTNTRIAEHNTTLPVGTATAEED